MAHEIRHRLSTVVFVGIPVGIPSIVLFLAFILSFQKTASNLVPSSLANLNRSMGYSATCSVVVAMS